MSSKNRDKLYTRALKFVLKENEANVSILQRHFSIGFSRAGRLLDLMEDNGKVGPYRGSQPREILVKENPEL